MECLRTIQGTTIEQPAKGRSKTRLFTNHDDQTHLLELFDLNLG